MNQALIDAVAERLKDYPLYSQENANGNPLILAKLFNAGGAGTWWLSEYNPSERIAFGWASIFGDENDEWGYIPLEELASITAGTWHCIEIDDYFVPTRYEEADSKTKLLGSIMVRVRAELR